MHHWSVKDPGANALSWMSVNSKGKRVAHIALRENLSLDHLRDLVAHEYAHLMVYDYPGKNTNGAWAVAYGECYLELWGDH